MQQEEADQEQKCQKWAATCDAYKTADWHWLPGELVSGADCLKAGFDF